MTEKNKLDLNKKYNVKNFETFINTKESSYRKNEYWKYLFNFVVNNTPECIVEFGILYGYSLFTFAEALKYNEKYLDSPGIVLGVDLFEKYEYNHASSSIAVELKNNMYDHVVALYACHAYDFKYNLNSLSEKVDMMHIDISNTGDTLKHMLLEYYPYLQQDGYVLFEGGTEERDNIEWMIKYNKVPIRSIFNDSEVMEKYNVVDIIEDFPSMTILRKK